jgi:large repetitive protein
MDVTVLKTDVTCNNGNDGALQAEVTGGASPLRYTWRNESGAEVGNNDLPAGTYWVVATDQQGCTQEKSITLYEPEAIVINVKSIPVCMGKANGEVWVDASGGVAPYQYSINGGATFQDNGIFKSVAAGVYEVQVTDGNKCPQFARAEVVVRKDAPQPNFIVATRQNALDTLVIKEISVPRPDSIEWTFDPAIDVLEDDFWSPLIKVKEPGNYPISMRGFFGGCDYTHTQVLTIDPYDPERQMNLTGRAGSINEVTAVPNPSDGRFNVTVELHAKQSLVIKVIDLLGLPYFYERWENTKSVSKEIDLSEKSLASGIYIMQVITDNDSREVRIAIGH